MKNKCPQCKSSKIKVIDYLGTECIICKSCGFDQSKQYDIYPAEKTSQKEKGRYTPYKTHGHNRTKR